MSTRTGLAGVFYIFLFLASNGWSADVLYATDGKSLFTVDLQTGALTFQSDGPLQWIASPAFDEEHHTALWLTDCSFDGTNATAQYSYGNPLTGETGGPYPASVTWAYWALSEPGAPGQLIGLTAYAPTTQRLYTLSTWYGNVPGYGDYNQIMPIMVDQSNGPPLEKSGSGPIYFGGPAFGLVYVSAMAFDPITGVVLIGAYGHRKDDLDQLTLKDCALLTLDPLHNEWWIGPPLFLSHNQYDSSGVCTAPWEIILTMAVDPTSGDIYYVRKEVPVIGDPLPPPVLSLRRLRTLPRAAGYDWMVNEDVEIATWEGDSWQLRFANDKWIQ
jgi:hypothetical protein